MNLPSSVQPVFLAVTQVSTYAGNQLLTRASGFFFRRGQNLFVVTSRHVLRDQPSGHNPDRITVEFHTDTANLARAEDVSVDLYRNGQPLWRQAGDSGGDIDVAVLPLEAGAIPQSALYTAFTPDHLTLPGESVSVGESLLVLGFPLGFHDTLHHMAVARQAILASAFGLRFKGQGVFLTDARTHRGSSGAPVLMRDDSEGELPWKLLGIHSSRLDTGREPGVDEALGLNCAWYVDVLLTLTESPA